VVSQTMEKMYYLWEREHGKTLNNVEGLVRNDIMVSVNCLFFVFVSPNLFVRKCSDYHIHLKFIGPCIILIVE